MVKIKRFLPLVLCAVLAGCGFAGETVSLDVDSASSPDGWQRSSIFETSLNGGERYRIQLNWKTESAVPESTLQLRLCPDRKAAGHWDRVFGLDLLGGPQSVETTVLIPEGMTYSAKIATEGAVKARFKKIKLEKLPRLSRDDLYGDKQRNAEASTVFEPIGMCHHFDRFEAPSSRPDGWGAFSDEEFGQALDALEKTPTQWVRITLSWNEAEPEKGKYGEAYLNRIDRMMDWFDKARIKYYVQIAGTARWASSNKTSQFWSHPPEHLQDWEDFVRYLGTRYHQRTHFWEVLNEPDWHFWHGTVAQYVDSLKSAAQVLKQINPEIKILNGGLSSDGVIAGPGIEQQFLQKMFDLGAADFIDIYSQHMYTPDVEEAVYRVNRFYSVMKKNGAGEKPIWITEIGMSTFARNGKPVYTDADQKKYLEDLYTILVRHPKVEKIFWYNFRCKGTDPNDKESNFGIFRRDFSPRPAGASYLQLKKPVVRTINPAFLSVDGL